MMTAQNVRSVIGIGLNQVNIGSRILWSLQGTVMTVNSIGNVSSLRHQQNRVNVATDIDVGSKS